MQRLKAVVADKDSQSVAACLPPWAYVYNKLVMDNNRSADVSHCMQLSLCMRTGMRICMCLQPHYATAKSYDSRTRLVSNRLGSMLPLHGVMP